MFGVAFIVRGMIPTLISIAPYPSKPVLILYSQCLQCAEHDDGRSVRVPLGDFYEYMVHQQDDSPLYIYDSTFGRDDKVSLKHTIRHNTRLCYSLDHDTSVLFSPSFNRQNRCSRTMTIPVISPTTCCH